MFEKAHEAMSMQSVCSRIGGSLSLPRWSKRSQSWLSEP